MREIKFRAWLKKEKRLIEVSEINFERGILSIPVNEECYSIVKSFEDIELMQYTGLKDKNGKEIYEGDILKIKYLEEEHYRTTTEEYERIDIVNNTLFGEILSGYYESVDDEHKRSIEVIGNIHENPELLESEVAK